MGGGLASGTDGLPLAQDFKDEDGAGRGDIEAVFVAVHRNLDQLIAALKRVTANAEGPIAHDEGQGTRIVQLGAAAALRRRLQRPHRHLARTQVLNSDQGPPHALGGDG